MQQGKRIPPLRVWLFVSILHGVVDPCAAATRGRDMTRATRRVLQQRVGKAARHTDMG